MLTLEDFRPENWPQVTWQILSHNYAWGSVKSEVIPPAEYLDWLVSNYRLFQPAAIKILFDVEGEKSICWRIIIAHAFEQIESNPADSDG